MQARIDAREAAGIVDPVAEKSRQLLAALREREAKNEAADADPKKKGKGAKTPQEIQDELDQLLSFDKSGWILMDFPRNLN